MGAVLVNGAAGFSSRPRNDMNCHSQSVVKCEANERKHREGIGMRAFEIDAQFKRVCDLCVSKPRAVGHRRYMHSMC